MLELVKLSKTKPTFSLFIPFTRDWIIDAFLENLDTLLIPLSETELVFYNDTDDTNIQHRLRQYIENSNFLSGKLYMSGNKAPTETNATIRRERIVAMKNKSRELISDSDYTIGLEDDTFPIDPSSIRKLIDHIDGQENVGFVSGVERGRWGFSIIGAWEMDNVDDPTHVSTLPYRNNGVRPVDGAGWFCYITPTNLYKNANYRFEADCLGPDVCYVMDLRRQKYECLIDWTIVCAHRTRTANLLPDEECAVASWKKIKGIWTIQKLESSKDRP